MPDSRGKAIGLGWRYTNHASETPMNQPPRTLHGTRLSGHTHRVMLFLHLLGLDHAFADSPAAVRDTPAFRTMNPLGQVPMPDA
jgi:glutathione S-transferase